MKKDISYKKDYDNRIIIIFKIKTRIETKIKLYKITVTPLLMYGNLDLTKYKEKKIQVEKMN